MLEIEKRKKAKTIFQRLNKRNRKVLNMKKILLKIEGMTCSACSSGLEKYLNKQEGIIQANVNLVMTNSLIEYDETIVNQKQIETFIKKAGFKSLGIDEGKTEENKQKQEKGKFIFFGILAVFLLYLSMGHMMGIPVPEFFHMHLHPINYAVTLLLLTIAFCVYGFDLLKNGYKNLIHRTPNMDTLVAIGVISSVLYSLYGMIKISQGDHSYVEHLYFESAAIVIFFIKLGRYIDGISKDKTKEAIQKLVQITPNKATIRQEGKEIEVTLDEIKQGDIVISKPGERIAVDGKIIEGKSHLDESFITGESKPVTKTIGNEVIAGSINYDGYLAYEAKRIGKESTISQIVQLVIEATNTKAPIAKIADQVSGYFVPIVILIAILTFIGYLLIGGTAQINQAVSSFVTILVVACPCALGLATPLAIVVSEGKCANHGILVKKSEILEKAKKIDTLVFDKTGTLTYGTLKIAKIINLSQQTEQPKTEEQIMQLATSLEKKSTHPISKAFEEYQKEHKTEILPVTDFENKSGYGITGKIDGKRITLGNEKMVKSQSKEIGKQTENPYQAQEKALAQEGNSIIYVVENETPIAIIGVNDVIRENAKQIIQNLQKQNIETIMLTGDNQETARIIAKQVGINNIIADVLPSEKAQTIQTLKQKGKQVMMCGDGINDSPALANSDIGVSISGASDIAMDSSDVILMKDDLGKITDLIEISKKTIRNIKQNLFWAFFYNVLMIPIAMGILTPWGITINPMIAGLAMVLSSLTVILNALRLKKE